MNYRVIGFLPPVVGTEKDFNTFRLGSFYTKNLSPGETVLLLNEKDKMVFGKAKVMQIHNGPLSDMLIQHAHTNHTLLNQNPLTAPAALGETLQKIYGPHIATPNKKTTVIYLRRLE